MPTTDNLDCKIYVEANVAVDDLAQLVARHLGGTLSGPVFGMTISTPVCDVEVRRNPDQRHNAAGGQDRFLAYPKLIEIYPDVDHQREKLVALVGRILKLLWSQGWSSVAACDYEAELPSNRGNGKTQKIGGTDDIIIPAFGDPTALDNCVQIIRNYWPDARFENAIADEKYRSYVDIPFGRVQELFVYRDAAAEAAWDADSDDSPQNSMLYLLCSPRSVTVVLDDQQTPEMQSILASVRDALSMDILNTYAEAA